MLYSVRPHIVTDEPELNNMTEKIAVYAQLITARLAQECNLTSVCVFQVIVSGSMVQAELLPAVATPIPQRQPITACHHLGPPVVPLPRLFYLATDFFP